LQETTISFVISVRLFVRMEQLSISKPNLLIFIREAIDVASETNVIYMNTVYRWKRRV